MSQSSFLCRLRDDGEWPIYSTTAKLDCVRTSFMCHILIILNVVIMKLHIASKRQDSMGVGFIKPPLTASYVLIPLRGRRLYPFETLRPTGIFTRVPPPTLDIPSLLRDGSKRRFLSILEDQLVSKTREETPTQKKPSKCNICKKNYKWLRKML